MILTRTPSPPTNGDVPNVGQVGGTFLEHYAKRQFDPVDAKEQVSDEPRQPQLHWRKLLLILLSEPGAGRSLNELQKSFPIHPPTIMPTHADGGIQARKCDDCTFAVGDRSARIASFCHSSTDVEDQLTNKLLQPLCRS